MSLPKPLFQNIEIISLSLSVCTALWCNCTTAQCEKTGSRCETDGACMASTSFINGLEQHIRICITRDNLVPPGQPFYCLSAEGLLYTHCCYTNYCNSLDLKVTSGESTSTSTMEYKLYTATHKRMSQVAHPHVTNHRARMSATIEDKGLKHSSVNCYVHS